MYFNEPNIENEAVYIKFIEKTINTQLPDNLSDLELFELLKTYQTYAHSKTCWKYSKKKSPSHTVDTLLRSQVFQNYFIVKLALMKSKTF